MGEPVNFADLFGDVLARAEALEAHRATCRAVPCADCGRAACPRCGKESLGEGRLCHRCALAATVDVARATVPLRFRWALDASRELLDARISFALIPGGLAWARMPETRGLVLRGASGAGKTSLAVAMFGAWLEGRREPGARFVDVVSLSLARARHPLGQGEAPAILEAMRAPLVVLDDLGQEQPNRAEIVVDVVMARHNANLPTWATTWLGDDDIARRYSGGVLRRLTEGAKVAELELPTSAVRPDGAQPQTGAGERALKAVR